MIFISNFLSSCQKIPQGDFCDISNSFRGNSDIPTDVYTILEAPTYSHIQFSEFLLDYKKYVKGSCHG